MLINLAILFDKPTGITTYANRLIPQLKPLEPTLLTARSNPDFACYPIPDNLSPASGSRGHLRRLLWTQFKVPQILRQFDSPLLFSPVPEAPLYHRSRFVVTVHDLIPLHFPELFARSPLLPYFRYYIPRVLRQAQHILSDSQATARDIADFYQISSDRVTVVPLACDRAHFQPCPTSTPHPPYFFYVGRHDPYKNLHRAIAAFARLRAPDSEFLIAGGFDPRYTPALQGQVAALELGDRVKFLKYVPYAQLPELLSNALALVFPSLREGFGLPVLEAMACGAPVITSNFSSLPEVAGEAALLVNPYETSEIAAAMQQIWEDSEARSQLSQLGLERAQLFSWEKTGQKTLEVLRVHGD